MGLSDTVTETSEFYDRWTELFHRGFGPVFQAGMLRTGHPPREDPVGSVLALAERAGVRDGDRVLDAGCGVAGPASIIATRYRRVSIDALTNSRRQVEFAEELLRSAGVARRVRVHLADYHSLPFETGVFDLVIFFESTGYAEDLERVYSEAARVLRPGGRLYVKDVFCRDSSLDGPEQEQMRAFDHLWGCVRTKTIVESATAIGAAGLEVLGAGVMSEVGTARLAGAMFTLDSTWGLEPTEMGRRFAPRGMDAPVEFGEILAVKPPSDVGASPGRSTAES